MNITIVGGGFGGVKTALELSKNRKNTITLITDKPDFQYYPALYSAATGYSHLESWVPLGEIFAGKMNIHVHIDKAVAIDPVAKNITGASGQVYEYDKCIMALGVVTTYFGIKGLDTYSYGIKSADEIKRLKHRIYVDIAEHHTLDKHYVVIGAGPTGVELAGAMGTYLKQLCHRYGVKDKSMRITLIEAAPRVLPRMSEKTSEKVTERLKALGVNVLLNTAVKGEDDDEIFIGNKSIKSHTVIWTSGVMNHPFYKENSEHFKIAPNGRVEVNQHMLAAKDVYVIGDNAATPYTGLAQTALHDAIFVARNILRQQKKRRPKEYKAVKPPVVVPVGEGWAAFEWKWIFLYGRLGSLLRRAADFVGYSDILPIGQALGVWHATTIKEDDYFTPSSPDSPASK
jgi:NADH dehydrogenase